MNHSPAFAGTFAPGSRTTWDVAEAFGQLRSRPGRDGARRIYLDFGRFGRVYSHKGERFPSERHAAYVLSTIRTMVQGGLAKSTAVERFLPTSSPAHSIGRWTTLWIARVRELVAAGERSAAYLAEIERWCGTGEHAYIARTWRKRSVYLIDYPSLESWSRELERAGLSAKTRLNVMAALHAALVWARRMDGDIPPLPPFPWPRVAEHAPVLLSPEDQARVIDAIPAPARGIFLALALLGLRPSEARRLRVADYAPGDPGWLTMERTKNGRVKRVPVPDALAEWIEQHVDREARLRGAPLFVMPYAGRGRRGRGPWPKSSLRRTWVAACAAAKVEARLYEGTKHSRATDLLRLGVPERVLQVLLGHRDVRSTRRYARLADEALVEAIAPRRKA